MLPPHIMVSEPGSFAEHTIVRRKPQIIADIIAHNDYPPDILAALGAFAQEIAEREVEPLQHNTPDAAPCRALTAFWRRAWQPWEGKTWRQLGWFFAEAYFYRRLLEVVRYFEPGHWRHVDPFAPQKRIGLEQGLAALAGLYAGMSEQASLEERFSLWLDRSLWGNRADLSNLLVRDIAHEKMGGDAGNPLLIDHTPDVWRLLADEHVRRLDLIADNSGMELLSDLGLLDFLLAHQLVETVHLHLKRQPFFVSDAMPTDLQATLCALEAHQASPLRALGQRLHAHQDAGRIVVHAHPFWTQCLFFSQFPGDLMGDLSQADLIILKGDANYRRILEDRHWPPTANLEAIAAYMPRPFLTVRTIKSEIIVGLPEGKAEALTRKDPTWLINGDHGLIQLVP